MKLSEANPLVARTFAIFLLATCEAPVKPNRERIIKLLLDAKTRDLNNLKFQTAHIFYLYALTSQPYNINSLLNYSLINYFIFNNTIIGEKLFRRCLIQEPFNETLISLWEYINILYPIKIKLLYYPLSRIENNHNNIKKSINNKIFEENKQWVTWIKMKDIMKYEEIDVWFNPITNVKQIEQPNFPNEWKLRKARSLMKEKMKNIVIFYDPLTQTHFQYHELTDTYE